MSRSEIDRKKQKYLEFRATTLKDLIDASASHSDEKFTEEIGMLDYLLTDAPDKGNRKYFRKRLLEDLQNNEFTFGVTATVRALSGCCLEHYGEPSYEILAPLAPSINILHEMLAFNEKFKTNFFPFSEAVKDVTLDRMRETKEKLLPMLPSHDAVEETRVCYDGLIEKLSSLKEPIEERAYKNPLKNILNIIRKATCMIIEGEDDRTEADVWEAYKRLYNTREKDSETTHYIKPIIDILALSVRDKKTQLLARRGLYDGIAESGGRPYAGVVASTENIMMVSGKSLRGLTGVIAHEATHLADSAISSVDTGYFFSSEHSDRLDPILLQIVNNHEKLPDFIKEKLLEIQSYPPEDQKTELLAFSIQLISAGEETLRDLKTHLPDLVRFFDEVFIPRCHEFIKSRPPLEIKSFDDAPDYCSSDEYDSDAGKKVKAGEKRKTFHSAGAGSASGSGIRSSEKADPHPGAGGSLFPISVSAPPSGSVKISSTEHADPSPSRKRART